MRLLDFRVPVSIALETVSSRVFGDICMFWMSIIIAEGVASRGV
jgi:hypothetical protein